MSFDPYPDLVDPATGRVGDDGGPGDRPELSEADSKLLEALSQPEPPVVTAVEDEPRTARAAQEDSTAPAPTVRGRGPLAPVFREPTA